eukprot:GHUV01041099.1.p1 GENE.GHUV01041099.1~~GHUV01041099.1.p1  ORF type:complete len:191 (+),score=50.71 GHUV01041099.1:252-824(+)
MVKMGVMGGSGHVNNTDYRDGILVGNWYENAENRAKAATGEHILGLGAPFRGEPTTAASQQSEGRTGAELAASYARTDLTRVGKCVPAAQKFSHSDPHEPPAEYFATVNQLAHGEKCLDEPPVQQYLWSGRTKNNALVPVSTLEESSTQLGDAKRNQWRQETADDMYTTTTQVGCRLKTADGMLCLLPEN